MIRCVLSVLIGILSIIFCMSPLVHNLNQPELTQMKVFLKTWHHGLVGLMFAILSVLLWKDVE